MYKRILFPTDGSEQANRALQYVKDIAGKFNSEVVVLYAYEVSDEITRLVGKVDKGISKQLDEMEQHLIEYGNNVITEADKKFNENGIKPVHAVLRGDPGHVIISKAEAENCDIIIMGSRGLGKIKSFLMGSTSSYVLHHAKVPVIIVH